MGRGGAGTHNVSHNVCLLEPRFQVEFFVAAWPNTYPQAPLRSPGWASGKGAKLIRSCGKLRNYRFQGLSQKHRGGAWASVLQTPPVLLPMVLKADRLRKRGPHYTACGLPSLPTPVLALQQNHLPPGTAPDRMRLRCWTSVPVRVQKEGLGCTNSVLFRKLCLGGLRKMSYTLFESIYLCN